MLLLLASLSFANPSLVGHWSNEAGSFTFTADGGVRMAYASGQVFDGTWSLQGGLLTVQTQAGAQQFAVSLAPGALTLVDGSGASYGFARAQAAAPAQAPTAALSDAQFVQFLQTYRQLDGDGVTAHLAAMTEAQHLWLNIYENLGSDVWTRACTGSHASQLVWPAATGQVGCATLLQQRRDAYQWGVNPEANADMQRDEVLIAYRCKTGEIDASSCSTYTGVRSQTNQGMHDVMTRHIDGMNAPCTRYYEQGSNQYLGCW